MENIDKTVDTVPIVSDDTPPVGCGPSAMAMWVRSIVYWKRGHRRSSGERLRTDDHTGYEWGYEDVPAPQQTHVSRSLGCQRPTRALFSSPSMRLEMVSKGLQEFPFLCKPLCSLEIAMKTICCRPCVPSNVVVLRDQGDAAPRFHKSWLNVRSGEHGPKKRRKVQEELEKWRSGTPASPTSESSKIRESLKDVQGLVQCVQRASTCMVESRPDAMILIRTRLVVDHPHIQAHRSLARLVGAYEGCNARISLISECSLATLGDVIFAPFSRPWRDAVCSPMSIGARVASPTMQRGRATGHFISREGPLVAHPSFPSPVEWVIYVAFHILSAIAHLNTFGIVCRNISPESIRFNASGTPVLMDWALYHITHSGFCVPFPIGDIAYTAPQVLEHTPECFKVFIFSRFRQREKKSGGTRYAHAWEDPRNWGLQTEFGTPPPEAAHPSVDAWSLGLVLLQVMHIYGLSGVELGTWENLTEVDDDDSSDAGDREPQQSVQPSLKQIQFPVPGIATGAQSAPSDVVEAVFSHCNLLEGLADADPNLQLPVEGHFRSDAEARALWQQVKPRESVHEWVRACCDPSYKKNKDRADLLLHLRGDEDEEDDDEQPKEIRYVVSEEVRLLQELLAFMLEPDPEFRPVAVIMLAHPVFDNYVKEVIYRSPLMRSCDGEALDVNRIGRPPDAAKWILTSPFWKRSPSHAVYGDMEYVDPSVLASLPSLCESQASKETGKEDGDKVSFSHLVSRRMLLVEPELQRFVLRWKRYLPAERIVYPGWYRRLDEAERRELVEHLDEQDSELCKRLEELGYSRRRRRKKTRHGGNRAGRNSPAPEACAGWVTDDVVAGLSFRLIVSLLSLIDPSIHAPSVVSYSVASKKVKEVRDSPGEGAGKGERILLSACSRVAEPSAVDRRVAFSSLDGRSVLESIPGVLSATCDSVWGGNWRYMVDGCTGHCTGERGGRRGGGPGGTGADIGVCGRY